MPPTATEHAAALATGKDHRRQGEGGESLMAHPCIQQRPQEANERGRLVCTTTSNDRDRRATAQDWCTHATPMHPNIKSCLVSSLLRSLSCNICRIVLLAQLTHLRMPCAPTTLSAVQCEYRSASTVLLHDDPK
eukprot:6200199-Pleurochrysis_carterae.AAC.2